MSVARNIGLPVIANNSLFFSKDSNNSAVLCTVLTISIRPELPEPLLSSEERTLLCFLVLNFMMQSSGEERRNMQVRISVRELNP